MTADRQKEGNYWDEQDLLGQKIFSAKEATSRFIRGKLRIIRKYDAQGSWTRGKTRAGVLIPSTFQSEVKEIMPEIYMGDLSQVKLFDILKPLLMGKKTGRMAFKGREAGEIYLEMGDVVHAKTLQFSGESAFFLIMELKSGRITFEPDASPRERTISTPSEQLLLQWSYRKQEMERVRELVPSGNTVFRLSLQRSPENKSVSGDQWNVLALCNGMRMVNEVAKTLAWDEARVMRTIYQLVQAGLLEKTEAPKISRKKAVGENFFLLVENELKRILGPVAPIILEERLAEFGETRESLLQDQALSFIESLSEEIPNEQKKRDFIKAVMEFLSPAK